MLKKTKYLYLVRHSFYIYLPQFPPQMKIKNLGWAVLLLLILINIWAIMTDNFWVENSSYIFFYFTAVLLVIDEYKKFNNSMYIFLVFTVLGYLVRYYNGQWYSNEISLVLFSVANIALILEASKFIEIKNASNYMLLYFIAIVGINGALLGYHVMEIREYLENTGVFSVYLLYYLNLLILGIISFIYYLNSYSRKSMFFISLALGIIFADVLRDMGVFFPEDISVEIAESIIRLGCSVFAVSFFVTKEKQLRLMNMI